MMQKRLLLCQSQSEAMMLARRLTGGGIEARPVRATRSSKIRSCSWAVEINRFYSEQAEQCLFRANIPLDSWHWEDEG